MRIEKELAEMHDGEVQLLSLVETGANAAPFKRMKSEKPEGEIDVFKAEKLARKAGVQAPQLIALAVSPEGDIDAAKAIAKACEIEIHDEREVEGDDGKTTLLITQKNGRVDTTDPTQVQIQLDDELTAVCRVSKTFLPFNGSTSFGEAIKAQGYFPQLRNALDVFGEVAFHILDSADSPSAASAKIQKSGDELVSLLTLMTKALPKDTFKAAELIKKLKAEGDEGTETLASKEDEKAAAEKAEAKKIEDAAAAKTKADADADAADADADGDKVTVEKEAAAAKEKAEHDEEEDEKAKAKAKKPKVKDTPSELAQVLKAIEALTETVAAQGEAQGKLKEQLEVVAAKAGEAEEAAAVATAKAKATDEAVSGRVSTDTAPDGRRVEERVRKGVPPLMDTGMAALSARGGAN